MVTACFGGIQHVWVKVVPLWEVVLSRKQGELRIAAMCVTVVMDKWLREADLPPSSGLQRALGTRMGGVGHHDFSREGLT